MAMKREIEFKLNA